MEPVRSVNGGEVSPLARDWEGLKLAHKKYSQEVNLLNGISQEKFKKILADFENMQVKKLP